MSNYVYPEFGTSEVYSMPFDTTSGWTISAAGTGTATINTISKYAQMTMPANGDRGYLSYLISNLNPNLDSSNMELIVRFSVENGDTYTRAAILISSTTSTDAYQVNIWGDGTFERGAYVGNVWNAEYTAPAAVALDGTGWARIRIRGSLLETAYGTGTISMPPSRWKIMTTYPQSLSNNGLSQFDNIRLVGEQNGVPSATVVVKIYSVNLRSL